MTPTRSRKKSLPAILASDAERDHAAALLREAAVEGRLTLEEFSDRISRAIAARTRDELIAVTADLPVPLPAPSAYMQRAPVEWSVGVMSVVRRVGSWRVGHQTTAVACCGTVILDLRMAIIDSPVVTVDAVAVFGNIEILVPEGVAVELEGLAIMGTRNARLTATQHLRGMPVVRVRGYALLGSVMVRNNRGWLKETFDQLRNKI
jgi:Domain of unknown function (DUF1707)/Cell wall-active antibiotics response 4TMS YvqF